VIHMTELGEVISTGPLEDELTPVVDVCGRELIGLTCLRGTGYGCLCQQVASAGVKTLTNDEGTPRAVVLTLGLIPNQHDPAAVMESLRLTGYVADMAVSRTAVVATWHLAKPVNAGLKTFVQDMGL